VLPSPHIQFVPHIPHRHFPLSTTLQYNNHNTNTRLISEKYWLAKIIRRLLGPVFILKNGGLLNLTRLYKQRFSQRRGTIVRTMVTVGITVPVQKVVVTASGKLVDTVKHETAQNDGQAQDIRNVQGCRLWHKW
jgi:F420-0:gamma-glutamyl ligase-like protein